MSDTNNVLNLKRNLLRILMFLVSVVALIFIGEIWFNILDSEIFIKIVATVFILFGLLAAYMIFADSLDENKRMKDDNIIN